MKIPDNGYIEAQTTKGGGFENGIPVKSSESWGEKIPCHIHKNMQDNKGNYKDGKFTRYAFVVWFDMREFEAKRVRLTNNRGREIGLFEVQSLDFMDLTQRVKVTV